MPKRNTSITDFLLCMMYVCVHSGVCELGGHVPAIAHVWKPEKDLSCQLYFGPSPLFFHSAHQLACVCRFLCLSLLSMVLEDAAIADSSTSCYMSPTDLNSGPTRQSTFTPGAISTEEPPYDYFSPHTGNNVCRKTTYGVYKSFLLLRYSLFPHL